MSAPLNAWLAGKRIQVAWGCAVQDVDAVISDAALSEDADVLLEGVSVASRIAACNGVWLERQRDQAWASLWGSLAALDVPRFKIAIAASDSLMGLNAGYAAPALGCPSSVVPGPQWCRRGRQGRHLISLTAVPLH